jgi:hypothetical protein
MCYFCFYKLNYYRNLYEIAFFILWLSQIELLWKLCMKAYLLLWYDSMVLAGRTLRDYFILNKCNLLYTSNCKLNVNALTILMTVFGILLWCQYLELVVCFLVFCYDVLCFGWFFLASSGWSFSMTLQQWRLFKSDDIVDFFMHDYSALVFDALVV